MKIGVIGPSLADDFFVSDAHEGYYCNFYIDDILNKVQNLGLKGLQTYNVGSEMDPSEFTDQGIPDLKKKFDSKGIAITALLGCMDFVGEHNYSQKQSPESLEGRIQKFCDILDFGVKLGAPIVTTESGNIINGEDFQTGWNRFIGVVKSICEHAEKVNGYFTLELGACCMVQTPDLLEKAIKEVNSDNFKVNFDPANVVMGGFDPVECVYRFADRIVHTHAKDGIKGKVQEVLIGTGDVPWPEYIKALKDIGYDGWLVIEREVGEDPIGDIRKEKLFLENLLRNIDVLE